MIFNPGIVNAVEKPSGEGQTKNSVMIIVATSSTIKVLTSRRKFLNWNDFKFATIVNILHYSVPETIRRSILGSRKIGPS